MADSGVSQGRGSLEERTRLSAIRKMRQNTSLITGVISMIVSGDDGDVVEQRIVVIFRVNMPVLEPRLQSGGMKAAPSFFFFFFAQRLSCDGPWETLENP